MLGRGWGALGELHGEDCVLRAARGAVDVLAAAVALIVQRLVLHQVHRERLHVDVGEGLGVGVGLGVGAVRDGAVHARGDHDPGPEARGLASGSAQGGRGGWDGLRVW